jgi:4-methyl-5(b-hydroxyethyl)-thiazole monophosphate biosynthesis
MNNILFLLMDGFEEMEAVIPIDILRRLEFNVVTAGADTIVTGAHNLKFETDTLISNITADQFDAVVLPGGMPGSKNLRDSEEVINIIRTMHENNKIVAAICAAPIALAKAGIMNGITCTAYPMPLTANALDSADLTENPVERDGNIITGKGPGAAFEFAFKIASAFGKEKEADELKKMMFVTG